MGVREGARLASEGAAAVRGGAAWNRAPGWVEAPEWRAEEGAAATAPRRTAATTARLHLRASQPLLSGGGSGRCCALHSSTAASCPC